MPANEMVGRGPELARLERALERLGRGRAPAFQVVGEPGIGKSRLLAELCARAGRGERLVFVGRGSELERDLPFAVFVDALDAYLDSLSPAAFRGLAAAQRDRLAAIFPALAGLGEGGAVLPEERHHAHHAVRALLEMLARSRPCLLVLDDVHWADQASLELLAHLLRRAPQASILVVLAYRSTQAPKALARSLQRAERDGACDRIELAPLTRAEAGELLGGSVSARVLDDLYRESGGNPFYLEQLARAATREGVRTPIEPGAPSAVAAAVSGELALLSERSLVFLRGAAAAGEPFTVDLAAETAGVAEAAALEALDEASRLGLVRRAESPRWFRFRHPIVRRAVYDSAGEGWRIGAHARAAAALAARGAPAAARAHHLALSARAGDEDAIAVLVEAGHVGAPLAPASSARWFAAALELVPDEPATAGRRLELLVPLATALGASGRLAESRDALRDAVALLPAELAPVRGQLVSFMALIEHLLGRHGEGRALLERALSELPERRSPEAAALQVELASDRYFTGDWKGMREWAERAWRLSRETGPAILHAAAAGILGVAEYSTDRIAAARERMDEARDLLDGLSDDELAARLDACHWTAWCEHNMERYDDAVRHMTRGLAVSRATGQGHMLVPMTIGLVLATAWQGRLPEAREHAEAALEAARLSGSAQLLGWGETLCCWVRLHAGDLEAALQHGEEALRAVESVVESPDSVYAAGWYGEALIEAGQPERGRELILEAAGGPELADGVERAFRPYFHEVLTRAELALGRGAEAATWAGRARAAAAGLDLGAPEAWALRAEAAVALAGGSPGPAAELARAAAARAGETGHRIEAARARTLAGQALAAAGARDEAVAELEAASAELDACGAARHRDLAVRELRRLGRRVGRGGRRGRGDHGLDALSAREREIAELVRDGLTNRQIAERLVLSEKTVEHHLASVFRKLGAASRVDVAVTLESGERDGGGAGRLRAAR